MSGRKSGHSAREAGGFDRQSRLSVSKAQNEVVVNKEAGGEAEGSTGAMLALLLTRRGARVKLLEMQHDFEREFRGDTIHPSTL